MLSNSIYISVRGNPIGLQTFASLNGFNTIINDILLDEDRERTPIQLKMKAIEFVAYVWRENQRSDELTSIDNIYAEKLENICEFFMFENQLYLERQYPFVEEDSLQWIAKVSKVVEILSESCVPIWSKDKRYETMAAWLNGAAAFLNLQLNDEDEDIKEHLEEIYKDINYVTKQVETYLNAIREKKEEL